jgi:hypothetical protein
VVALVLSFTIALGGCLGIYLYGKHRPVGAPLSWGQAMLAGVGVFALMFWSYGVVPHQWLTYAGNELSWRPDKVLIGWHLPFTGSEGMLQYFLPFSMNYENINHIGAVLIYGLFLTLNVVMFSVWQNRAKEKPVELTSGYGRPLVKQG